MTALVGTASVGAGDNNNAKRAALADSSFRCDTRPGFSFFTKVMIGWHAPPLACTARGHNQTPVRGQLHNMSSSSAPREVHIEWCTS